MKDHECNEDCVSLKTYPRRVEEWNRRNPPRGGGWVRPGRAPLTSAYGPRNGGDPYPALWDGYHGPLGDDRLFWMTP